MSDVISAQLTRKEKAAAVINLTTGSPGWGGRQCLKELRGLQTVQPSSLEQGHEECLSTDQESLKSSLAQRSLTPKSLQLKLTRALSTSTQTPKGVSPQAHHSKQNYLGQNDQ